MIIRYNNFIVESKYSDIEREYHSIGEYVEKLAHEDEYLIPIISNYINDADTDISISNAVNLLGDFDKKQLFDRVYNYINNGEKEKDVDIMANVVIRESNETFGGKNIFQSFLKSITALGLKNIGKSKDVPDNWVLYYSEDNISIEKLKLVFKRFRSLAMFLDRIDYSYNECGVYYGIKSDMTFEYGFVVNGNVRVGSFKVNRSVLKWLLLLQSPSSISMKKDLVSLSIENLLIYCKLVNEMSKYNLPYKQKSGPNINDGVLTFGYYGIGRWDNGVLDPIEYQNIKTNFKNWLMKFKWADKILVSITYDSFWVYFNIKTK